MVRIDERRWSLFLANTSLKKPTLFSRSALLAMTIRTRVYAVSLYSSTGSIIVHVCLEGYPNHRTALFHHLEYFRGIVFLTTNLLSNIDNALLSRCHIHLRYPSLSIQSRSTLWKALLLRLQNPTLSGQSDSRSEAGGLVAIKLPTNGFKLLAAWNLNGREIKNVVKTAHLWCCYNNSELTVASIEAAIRVTAPFADKVVTEEDRSASSKRPRLS